MNPASLTTTRADLGHRPTARIRAPTAIDGDATPADVHAAVENARKVYTLYNACDNLKLDEPWDYNRLPEATQTGLIKWMQENMK